MCIGGAILSKYLLSLIGIVLLSAILTAISPEGKTSGLIKSVMRMVCTLAIISPIVTFFYSGLKSASGVKKSETISSQSVIDDDATFIHYYSEMRVTETEKSLQEEIFERFSVDCEVELLWRFESEKVGKKTDIELIKITQICVKMIEKQEEEVVRKMWEYLTENYCSEVLIE